MKSNTRIAVIGGGLGGVAAARLLQKAGMNAQVYEQAPSFMKLGAGIHISPNVMKVMRVMGIEKELEAVGSSPANWRSRDGVSGEILFEIALGDIARQRFGASYLTVRRGDFHELMLKTLQPDTLHFGKRLVDLNDTGKVVTLKFEDGTTEEADIVIGADGIHSIIREKLLGPQRADYTGDIAHRAMFSAKGVKGFGSDQCTKWWTDDRHIVVYYVDKQHDEIYYVTGVPDPSWSTEESWLPSSREEMREAFAGWHPTIQALIDATQEVTKWPLMDRSPLPIWSEGRLVLLGDACHPMKPHMAQGAGMAIEDAAMLVRCFQETGLENYESAFQLYKNNRSERATRVQSVSKANSWLRFGEDPSWCFGYDVFEVPLVSIEA